MREGLGRAQVEYSEGMSRLRWRWSDVSGSGHREGRGPGMADGHVMPVYKIPGIC